MKFNASSFEIFDKDWALLTAGTKDDFNTMTVSWGGLGTLWGKAVATVYVRPNRYTHDFMERGEYFTLSFYGEEFREALETLGTLSGRDCDKVAKTGLIPKEAGETMTFAQAKKTLLCRKLYRQELDPAQIPEDVKKEYYDGEPVHTLYIGEVLEIFG